jgi:hypothetical protein
MHDCQRFREDWVVGLSEDFDNCESCRSFCEEAHVILQATAAAAQPIAEMSEAYWDRFDDRLRAQLVRENRARSWRLFWQWSTAGAAAAAIVVVITWSGMRVSHPALQNANTIPQIEFAADHIKGLNPTVVTFLGESELFLRNVTKLDPSYEEDLQEARSQAKESLAEIERQKLRAADFSPVRRALDEYASVLRDIKNLDSSEDIADIQSRIRRSGLIANMRAYQPQVVLVGNR